MATISTTAYEWVENNWNISPFSTEHKQCISKMAAIGGNTLYKGYVAIAALVIMIATPFFILLNKLLVCKERIMAATPTILDFYKGGKNNNGVTLEEIWKWDRGKLEAKHDFIQWLFPLETKSQFNVTAPTTDKKTVEAFRESNFLKAQMRRSLDVMLQFYGFIRMFGHISQTNLFNTAKENWLTQGNHNYLRISRILRSLRLHGLEEEAHAFFSKLKSVYQENKDVIGENTFNQWNIAAHGS